MQEPVDEPAPPVELEDEELLLAELEAGPLEVLVDVPEPPPEVMPLELVEEGELLQAMRPAVAIEAIHIRNMPILFWR